jgi:hypothetical protein
LIGGQPGPGNSEFVAVLEGPGGPGQAGFHQLGVHVLDVMKERGRNDVGKGLSLQIVATLAKMRLNLGPAFPYVHRRDRGRFERQALGIGAQRLPKTTDRGALGHSRHTLLGLDLLDGRHGARSTRLRTSALVSDDLPRDS